MRLWLAIVVGVLVASSLIISGQEAAPTLKLGKPITAPGGNIKITLRLSKGTDTPSDSFQVAADIKNVSDKTLFLSPIGIAMTPPPELDPQSPRAWHPLLPGTTGNFCKGASNCDEVIEKNKNATLVHDDSLQLADCYATFHNWNFFYHAYHCLQLQEKKDLDESPGLYDGLVELKPGYTTTASWNGFTRVSTEGIHI